MTSLDIRGASLTLADPPITTNPNADLAIKAPVRVATTGSNITLSGLQTIDGVALVAGDRVLVKDQTDATTNGLYNATTGSWTRTIDANNNSQWTQGTLVYVQSGTLNANLLFTQQTVNPIILGTSNLVFGTPFTFSANPAIGSVGAAGTINFPFNGENFVTLTGGAIGASGKPRLLFKPVTQITPPNNTLVGFGTDATWPFTYEDYQSAIVTVIDPNGAGAFFTAMRSSDWAAGNVTQPIGATFLGVHDKTIAGPNAVWNIYAQFNKTAGASNTIETFLCEMSYENFNSSVTQDPYNWNNAGGTHLLRIDSGTGTGSPNPVTSALEILNNAGTFNVGITIGNTSIATVSGHINAIQLPSTYEIIWYTSGSPGVFGGSINVDASSKMQFQSAAPQYVFNGASAQLIMPGATPVLNFSNNGSAFIAANGGASSAINIQANSVGVASFQPTFVSIGNTIFTVGGGTQIGSPGVGGLQVGSPTGGDLGVGTVNVSVNIFKNNTAYTNPDFVFERHYTGKIDKFAERPRAKDYVGLMSIADLEAYTREHLRLPRIEDEPTGIFTMADIALEKIEELTLYIFELQNQIDQLKGAP